MLLHLHIRNFAIVPSLEQDFLSGFTAISGETGAGKSILVDALGLLLGARSDAGWVRAGADRAELNAEFAVTGNDAASDWLREHELDTTDSCLLRRSIQAGGRSRAWINGTPVTVGQLAELGHLLVEVHGQNEHVRLAAHTEQLALLDRTGQLDRETAATAEAFDAWRAARDQLREQSEGAALPPSEIEFLTFQLSELDRTTLPPDAIAKLEGEHRLLSASGDLLKALDRSTGLLDDEADGATARLQAALGALTPFENLADEVREVRRMLDEALINAREAASALSGLSSDVELDPERLQTVEAQLSALGDLARKHGVAMEDLDGVRDRLARRLDQASRFDEIREALERDCEGRLRTYRDSAERLSRARKRQAKTLAGRVVDLMGELGMEGGRFEIRVEHDAQAEPSRRGTDQVEMRVSANPGIAAAPLARVASGGELSRISLAIKVATADSGARTQVFDEIDAGVGGDTANAVGRLLKKVAQGGQALCVTHLAQVAVRADQQLKVSKETGLEQTSVDARVLEAEARVEEIARMLGGTVSDQSRAHAREMLDAAATTLQ